MIKLFATAHDDSGLKSSLVTFNDLTTAQEQAAAIIADGDAAVATLSLRGRAFQVFSLRGRSITQRVTDRATFDDANATH